MDIHSNLEYLCRVCAANTKGKNSVAECVYILKTAGLKDKLDKFLYLKISDNDSLPKVLCKTCFRQVEATAALSKIAKHTQQVFREFLLSNLPKGPSESTNTSIDYTTSDYAAKKDAYEKSKKEEISIHSLPANTLAQLLPPQIPASVAAMLPPPLVQPMNSTPRKDEVIVNVSVSDPLTRDNQQKMISNSQRRQSLLLESRYTPKSIAQKPSTMASTLAVVNQKVVAPKLNATVETANTTNLAKINTTPTLNFYPINKAQQLTKQQQQQLPQNTQITTFSSGGYVIGRINDKEESKKTTLPLAPTADNVLQQKRKNLVKALNNIKANNSGQISLLKSSQQKQTNATSSSSKVPLTEVVNHAAEDELPENIIIAAPKNKLGEKIKKEPLNLSSKIPTIVSAITPAPLPNTPATITPIVQQQQIPEQTQAANFNNTPPKPAFPEDILLGRVIRDMDLLKLILKALKWPVNKLNMELQLQRLKNSKFTDIMSDSNLLQDTDLTQLLGPYLAPVLLAAQALQQQQQQILKNTALNQTMAAPAFIPQPAPAAQPKISALEAAQAEINKSIPYKLPPETSVQLVPATPEEQEAVQSPPLPNITTTTATSILKRDRQKETPAATEVPQKRQRRAAAQKARDSIVISDEEDVKEEVPKSRSRQRSNKNNNSNIEIELNSNFMAQFNLLTGSNSDEANAALLTLLQRQKDALLKDKKVQRRRRNSVSNLITLPNNEFDALIDLDDDIVLMEPVSTTSSADSVPAASNSQEISPVKQPDISNPFIIPSAPLITRPIIKRRKTVIHSSRGRLDKDATAISSSALAANKEKLMEETINQVAKGNMISDTANNEVVVVTTQTNPSKATNKNNESSPLTPAEVSNTKAAPQQKKTQSKSALGQQLLEAIGLQKISTKISNNTQTETATSSTITNNVAPMPNSKQSIQQIRSALKKSLKQAQEQQQQRKKELSSTSTNNTIIQDADSTTKPAVKEIVVVEGKGNKTDDNSSSMVDVEEQIDKVTLMVRKNDEKDVVEQPTTSEKEEKEEKKSPNTKIQERRRTMPAIGARGARNAAANDTKDKSNSEGEKEKEEKEPEKTKNSEVNNENSEKEDADNANISSSSVATSSETSATIKEEVVTPKRRGRKRLVDKQAEAETTEANEIEKDKESDNKEKDNKSSTAITERSRTTDKIKEEETDNNKNEDEQETTTSNKTSGRPTRQSKQQSKYYKGPEKTAVGRRSLPSRTTRNRKYS